MERVGEKSYDPKKSRRGPVRNRILYLNFLLSTLYSHSVGRKKESREKDWKNKMGVLRNLQRGVNAIPSLCLATVTSGIENYSVGERMDSNNPLLEIVHQWTFRASDKLQWCPYRRESYLIHVRVLNIFMFDIANT